MKSTSSRSWFLISYIIKNGNLPNLFLPLFTKSINITSLSIYKYEYNNNFYVGYYEYFFNNVYNLKQPTLEEYKKN